MEHRPDCPWLRANCIYRQTHEYCPHPEHACTCPVPKWRLHIAGPDDVHEFPDELEALRAANDVNKRYLKDRLENPGAEVLCVATVSEIGAE